MLIARTVLSVVVNDPAGLKVRVNRDRTEIFESPFLQFLRNLIRQPVAHRDQAFLVTDIQYRFIPGK